MKQDITSDSEWTGLRGSIMGWYLNSPFRTLSEKLFLGDSRSVVLAEAMTAQSDEATVLDVGAGSGYFSLAIARRLKRGTVVCLDLSSEMLQRLQRSARKEGLSHRVQVLEGSAYKIPLDDGSVTLAIANGVFHELVHPQQALREMVRVLRPGGKVVITDFRADTWIGRRIGAAHRSEDHGPFTVEELRQLLLGEKLQDVRVTALRGLLVGIGVKT